MNAKVLINLKNFKFIQKHKKALWIYFVNHFATNEIKEEIL